MKAPFYRFVSRVLILSMMTLPFPAQAGLISAGDIVADAQLQGDQGRVHDFIARADVQNQLVAFGVNPDAAKERVDALTNEELQQLAGKINELPAGADGGVGLAIVVLLLVVLILTLNRR